MSRLPTTYLAILNALIELYNLYRRPIKSKELASKLNINETTIRNVMIALKAMGFIDSKTGPYGGYVPTQKAFEYTKVPTSLVTTDVAPVYIGKIMANVYVTGIELLDILNPFVNRAIVRVIGDTKLIKIGDVIRIGPTVNSRVIIEGIVVEKNEDLGELVINIQRFVAIPKVKVSEIMTRNLITTTPKAKLKDVAKIFYEKRIRAIPVVDDDGRVIGIITTSEIAKAFYEGKLNALVTDYMRREVYVINSENDVFDAIRLMTLHGIGRLIVVDSTGKPIGIVTRTDILKYLSLLE